MREEIFTMSVIAVAQTTTNIGGTTSLDMVQPWIGRKYGIFEYLAESNGPDYSFPSYAHVSMPGDYLIEGGKKRKK